MSRITITSVVLKIVTYVTALICLVIFIGVGQLVQVLKIKDELSTEAITQWVGSDLDRAKRFSDFSRACLVVDPDLERGVNEIMEPVISIGDCAIEHEYLDIYQVYFESIPNIKNYAWPLSLIREKINPEL